MQSERESSICSADAIVWRVLAKSLPDQFSRAFRDMWTQRGSNERFMGRGQIR